MSGAAGQQQPGGEFLLDGKPVPFRPGQTILQAAADAGTYIHHLCYHPDLPPHGSCKVCTVKVDGRHTASCTMRAADGMSVESETPEIKAERLALIRMLFIEGNHFCPSCEKSGNCRLQATAYELGMVSPHYEEFFPNRPVDASHPDLLLEHNRCIFCSLCVRASRDIDGKSVFALAGRGATTRLMVNAESGRLVDTDVSVEDRAVHICPVGAILFKRRGFAVPIGSRQFDGRLVSEQPEAAAPSAAASNSTDPAQSARDR